MRREIIKGVVASVIAASAFAGAAAAQDAAEFYDGNVIRWIVPYEPGGGYDEYTRAIAPYFEEYTGARVDLVNAPGAGGMRGVNELAVSPPDGLTVGIINGSAMVTNQLAEIEGVAYDIGEFSYLGRMVTDLRVLVTGTQTPYDTFEDLVNAEEPVVVGATGLGGSTYVDAVVTGPAFGIEQRIVHGFDNSSDVRAGMLRGDVHAMWGSLGSAIQGVEDGEHRIVVQSAQERSPLVPDVPSVWEFVDGLENPDEVRPILEAWSALNEVGRPVAAPAGVPEDRLAFLREAFDQAMNDPEFIAMMTEAEREISYLSGEEMGEVARLATQMDPEVQEILVKAVRGEI